MNRLAPWLLAAAALAGCAKNTARPSAKMSGPQGVAVYRGLGADQPGVLRMLVAVANTRGDDLRIIDAVTDKVLAGPTVAAALSVPTEPLPSLIAAGSLHDQDTAGTNVLKSDLLVVAPRGQVWIEPVPPATAGKFGAVIQSIVTWDEKTKVDVTIPLADLLPDATLTSLLVVPAWERDPVTSALSTKAGAALVLACTSDGALVSILATRDPTDTKNTIVLAPPVVQLLGFACLDLAVSSDGTRVYAATIDPIPAAGGVLGVAEFDNTVNVVLADGTFPHVDMPIRALSARLGTTQVAALDVKGFKANTTDPEVDTFDDVAAPRVYAVLDPTRCGTDRSMPCGIAVIDPVLGTLAPDPAGELPYQLPIQVPGEVVDFAVSGPPATTDAGKEGLLKFDPGSGLRYTQAFAGVATTSGRIYLADLSHFSLGNAISPLAGTTGTRVIGLGKYLAEPGSAPLGFWLEPTGATASVEIDTLAIPGIAVTPGYTASETFWVTYQGMLPGLISRQAIAHVTTGAPSRIAVQEPTGLSGPGTSPWRGVARLYDPRLAVRVGDLVEVETFPSGSCPNGTFELEVTAILPPDPLLYPGGAVAVTPSASQPAGADPNCLPQNTGSKVTVSFRSRNLVLAGSSSGYAGRPDLVASPPDATARFEFKYEDEQALNCPIMPDDPGAWPPSDAEIASCEADAATCRATCERLMLARRARRSFYVTQACPDLTTATGLACWNRWVTTFGLQFPMPKGPVVAFKVGVKAGAGELKRGTYVAFKTSSGFVAGSRAPSAGSGGTGAEAPYGVTLFDRSAVTKVANDGIHGYAAFVNNLVLDFATVGGTGAATTIR